MSCIKTACIQLDCHTGDVSRNTKKAEQFIIKAKESGADLVILPELVSTGYDLQGIKHLDEQGGSDAVNLFAGIARTLRIHIVVGLPEAEAGKIFNTLYVFDQAGKSVVRYRKINLFPLTGEDKIFTGGTDAVSFVLGDIRFGLMICYDVRFPELSMKLTAAGCSVIIVSAAFPFPRLAHWKCLLKARAIENRVYVAASNRVGRDGDNWFLGTSCIINPWGVTVAAADEIDETIIFHEISGSKVNEAKERLRPGP